MHVASESLDPIPATPIVRILRPFQAFAENKTAGGVLLLLCTVAALVCANSPWAHKYTAVDGELVTHAAIGV